MSIKTPEEWGEMYADQIDKYDKFRHRLESLIENLIEENDVEFAPQITSRTKEKDSFIEKINRKSYKNPFEQCTDIIGIRIIVIHLDDLTKISNIIELEFLIDLDNSKDKSQLYDPDRFGYLSIHYVASLSESRSAQTEWKQYAGLKFEIQIRTILQHAWSEIDHKLRYKKEDEVPKELKRNLYRLIALLELADKEFKEIIESTKVLETTITKEIEDIYLKKEQQVDEITDEIYYPELNKISVNAYLKTTQVEQQWADMANKIISNLIKKCIPEKILNVEAVVFRCYENSQSILCISSITGIKDIYELDAVIKDISSFGEKILTKIYMNYLENLLKEISSGYSYRQFNSYDNLAVLVLYAKRNIFRDRPERLDKIKCIDYELMSGLKRIINEEL